MFALILSFLFVPEDIWYESTVFLFENFIPRYPFEKNNSAKELIPYIDLNFLEKNGIQTRKCFYPLHKQPGFKKYKYKNSDFPNSIFAYNNAMSLPVHLGLRNTDIKYICTTIKQFYKYSSGAWG